MRRALASRLALGLARHVFGLALAVILLACLVAAGAGLGVLPFIL